MHVEILRSVSWYYKTWWESPKENSLRNYKCSCHHVPILDLRKSTAPVHCTARITEKMCTVCVWGCVWAWCECVQCVCVYSYHVGKVRTDEQQRIYRPPPPHSPVISLPHPHRQKRRKETTKNTLNLPHHPAAYLEIFHHWPIYRSRIKTKAKVVAAVWGTDLFNSLHTSLAVLH